jgi:hypothetical protein
MPMKLFIHTVKAVRNGCPIDRVFLVVTSFVEGKLTYYQAYKCTITSQGLEHPGYHNPLSVLDLKRGKGQSLVSHNGAQPTAQFRKDSYYKEISLDYLETLIKLSTALPRQKIEEDSLKLAIAAGEKLEPKERMAIYRAMHNIESSLELQKAWELNFGEQR